MNTILGANLKNNKFIQLTKINYSYYVTILNQDNQLIEYFKETKNYNLALSWYNYLFYAKH